GGEIVEERYHKLPILRQDRPDDDALAAGEADHVNQLCRIAMDLVGHYLSLAAPPSAFKNQARTRAMAEQAPLDICKASFGSADPAAAIQHNALRLDPSCFWRNRSHE